MSDYERQKIEQVLHAKAVEKNPDIFDGKRFNPDSDLDTAYTYMNGFVRGMNKAVSAINGMSGTARNSEEGQNLLAEAQDKLAYSKAMTSSFRAFEAAKKAAPAAATATASAAASDSGGDGLTDEQRAPVAGPLDEIDAMMVQGIFDGAEIDMTVTTKEANAFADAFIDKTNAATKALNAMPGDLRRTPGGKALFGRVNTRLKEARALRKALSTHAEARKEFEAAASTAPTASASASGGDPATRAALDAFDALMADGRYDGKAFRENVPLEDAEAFNKEAVAAANAANDALKAGGDDTLRDAVSAALDKAGRIQGAIFNHRVVRQRIESAERKAREAEEKAKRAAMQGQCDAMRVTIVQPSGNDAANVVHAVATEASRQGWENAPGFPLIASLQGNLGRTFADIAETCEKPDFAAVVDSGVTCTRAPNNDPVAWCRTAAAFVQGAENTVTAAAALAAATPESCTVFRKKVLRRRLKRNLPDMVKAVEAGPVPNPSLERLAGLLDTADRLSEGCAEAAYADAVSAGCPGDTAEDPKTLCQAAGKMEDIARESVLLPRQNWEIIAAERYDNYDEMQELDGWATIEGPTSFAEALSYDRLMLVNTPDFDHDKQRTVLERLGIGAEDFPNYEDAEEFIDEFREAIEDGADGWPELPRAEAGSDQAYGNKLASRLIAEKWNPSAEVLDSWIGRGSWKIHKNELGVIQRRTLPGYVMFKLPEDPFCQVRSFTLTEQYTGSGTFQRAKGVRIGYVRFQDCDRR